MPSDTPLDHHFYQQMMVEHEELSRAMQEAHQVTSSPSPQWSTARRLLRSLQALIRSHFEHEEDGGYLKEALDQAPHLFDRIHALQRQHAPLREELDELCGAVVHGEETHNAWQQLGRRFARFGHKFAHHESREDDLVQEAFTEDIGIKD